MCLLAALLLCCVPPISLAPAPGGDTDDLPGLRLWVAGGLLRPFVVPAVLSDPMTAMDSVVDIGNCIGCAGGIVPELSVVDLVLRLESWPPELCDCCDPDTAPFM